MPFIEDLELQFKMTKLDYITVVLNVEDKTVHRRLKEMYGERMRYAGPAEDGTKYKVEISRI